MFLRSALAGQLVGLEEVDDGVWSIYFYKVLLGRFDERRFKIYSWKVLLMSPVQVSPMSGPNKGTDRYMVDSSDPEHR